MDTVPSYDRHVVRVWLAENGYMWRILYGHIRGTVRVWLAENGCMWRILYDHIRGTVRVWLAENGYMWRILYDLASYPGSRWAGKERAWYTLFAHAFNLPKIWGLRGIF